MPERSRTERPGEAGGPGRGGATAPAGPRLDAAAHAGPGPSRGEVVAVGVAATLLLWFTASSTLAALSFAAGRSLPASTAPLAAVGAFALSAALLRRSGGASGRVGPRLVGATMGAVLAVAAASGALALALLDLADDSQTYHLSAVVRLAQGWNPWREPLGESLFYGWALDHYPRASYVASAALYLATGRLDAAKATQLLLAVAAGALAWAAARRVTAGRFGTALALLLAANPVVLVQASTSYVDGLLGSALLAFGASLVLLASGPATLAALAATCAIAAGALSCGLKFTGVVFVLVLGAGLALVAAWRAGPRAGLRCGGAVAGALLLALALEANPYLTNLRTGGNPFWPVVGGPPGPWSRMAGDEPGEQVPSFAARGRVAQLLLSTFARADSSPGVEPGLRLKPPFVVHPRELRAFRGVDARASGFGPLFSGALVLAAATLALAWAHPRLRRRAGLALAAAAVLVASALAMPFAWWARYVPQLWAVPLLALAAAAGPASGAVRWVRGALALALAANVAIVAAVHLDSVVRGTSAHRAQLERLAALSRRHGPIPAAFGRSESHRVRLREHGVRFAEGALPCAAPVQLLSLTDTRLCPPEPVPTVVWP